MNEHEEVLPKRNSDTATVHVICEITSKLPTVLRDRFLFSLSHQIFTSYQLTIIADDVDTVELARSIDRFDWSRCLAVPRVIATNHSLSAKRARRQEIRRRDYRYLAIPDCSGTFYSRALDLLVQEATTSHAAVVFGHITSKKMQILETHVYEVSRCHVVDEAPACPTDTLSPLGACLFDRHRIRSADLKFLDTSGFLRLLSKYPASQVRERIPLYAATVLHGDAVAGERLDGRGPGRIDRLIKRLREMRLRIELRDSRWPRR